MVIHAEMVSNGADAPAAGVECSSLRGDPLVNRRPRTPAQNQPEGIQGHGAKPLRTRPPQVLHPITGQGALRRVHQGRTREPPIEVGRSPSGQAEAGFAAGAQCRRLGC